VAARLGHRPITLAEGLVRLQEQYLEIALTDPEDAQSLLPLVAVRRYIAGGDAALLRREAGRLTEAIRRGTETEEHYTAAAMALLAQASLLAAAEIESAHPAPVGAVHPAPVVAVRTDPAALPRPAAAKMSLPALVGSRRSVSPPAVVRGGEIYRVVSAPLTAEAAAQRAADLARAGYQTVRIPMADGRIRLQLGAFASPAYAAALAGKVQRGGLLVVVVRGPVSAAPVPAERPQTAVLPAPTRQEGEFFLNDGIRLYQSGWYGPALARFRQAARAAAASPRAHLWVGRAALKLGRDAEAREAFERTIALAPDSAAAAAARILLQQLLLASD
jgi:tetratricopeptide (TPR) repeat protein